MVRLHIGKINVLVSEALFEEDGNKEDISVILNRDESTSYYNELIHACGYHVSLVHNLILIFTLLILILLIWLAIGLKDYICKSRRRHDAWWNNMLIRVFYEVFFEVCLCIMINLTAIDFIRAEKTISWFLTLLVAVIAFLSLCILTFLFFCGGPNVPNSYE